MFLDVPGSNQSKIETDCTEKPQQLQWSFQHRVEAVVVGADEAHDDNRADPADSLTAQPQYHRPASARQNLVHDFAAVVLLIHGPGCPQSHIGATLLAT